MIIGYARISTGDQSFDLQLDSLRDCDRIFKECASGSKSERIELNRALSQLRSGDVLKVWRLDRLGRSLSHLLEIVAKISSVGANLRSVCDAIDTTTATGRLTFAVFGAIAEFERELNRERTIAGLAAARRRGNCGGRKKIMTRLEIETASKLRSTGMSVEQICLTLHISRSTFYRHVYDMVQGGEDLPGGLKL